MLIKNANPKTNKGNALGYTTYTLSLLPDKTVCPYADNCLKACLRFSGRGQCTNVLEARSKKTKLFKKDIWAFLTNITRDMNKVKPSDKTWVRLNTLSDLNYWHVIASYPNHNFYDYTKDYHKVKHNQLPNYHLTFSYDGNNWDKCSDLLQDGINVAVIFSDGLPKTYNGYKVIDGDEHDLRFLDPKGVIVGLKFKGSKARKEAAKKGGFVV